MPTRPYELLSPTGPRDQSQLARVINEIRLGRLDVSGEVTVATSASETVITDSRISPNSLIVAMVALDANSPGLEWWIKARAKGSLTIGHDVDGANDRAYAWIALG